MGNTFDLPDEGAVPTKCIHDGRRPPLFTVNSVYLTVRSGSGVHFEQRDA
jgi:hypothetical protein